jgi:hypothetical protein
LHTMCMRNRSNEAKSEFKKWKRSRGSPILASISCRFLVRRNVPDRVLRAMDMPTIDHRGPEFAQLGLDVLEGCRAVFRTKNPVVIYPSSGTGAWEAAIVNTLCRGDTVLMAETDHFAALWKRLVEKFELEVDFLPGDWRRGAQSAESRLAWLRIASIASKQLWWG